MEVKMIIGLPIKKFTEAYTRLNNVISPIENLENNAIDFYASVKSLYLQDRQQKILNTKKIVDMEKKESDEILKKIFEHQARLELTCRFTWTENTVCIWDNRSVIHFAIADFYPGRGLGYERVMDRIAIEGDRPQ